MSKKGNRKEGEGASNAKFALGMAALVAGAMAVLVTIYLPDTEEIREERAGLEQNDRPGPFLNIDVTGQANGRIRIDLNELAAPLHTQRMMDLAQAGEYDNVVFHRVIEGFMAQTGDVQYGKAGGDTASAGRGGSDQPDLKAEFSSLAFDRGAVGMARSSSPNSANSQFFIMFAPAPHLNGQYTVVGKVVEGMEVVDAIKRGQGQSGSVGGTPDVMAKVTAEPMPE